MQMLHHPSKNLLANKEGPSHLDDQNGSNNIEKANDNKKNKQHKGLETREGRADKSSSEVTMTF